jgi:hypothetical protein
MPFWKSWRVCNRKSRLGKRFNPSDWLFPTILRFVLFFWLC